MTDKEYSKQKRRVQKYLDKWFKTLGLGWFHVDMVWTRDRDEDVPGTAAKTTTWWQYRRASITWFMPAIADCDDEFLEGVVVHELVHVLVAPLCDNEEDHSLQHEYATESVARAIQWAREAGGQA